MRTRRYTYPENWPEISRNVRRAAGWKCQQCGAPHGVWIKRFKVDPSVWYLAFEHEPANEDFTKAVRCIVSVHHIGVDKPDGTPGDSRDKMDCRPENLIALCARCHLVADIKVSIKHARDTKLRIKRQQAKEAGQLEMFSE